MKLFWVGGILAPKAAGRRGKKPDLKPYLEWFWADSAQEAVQTALSANLEARWVEGPTVTEMSEEKRMRALGAPELPGLESFIPGKHIKKK